MYQTFAKRLLDITFALVILVATFPIALTIAAIIKCESKGPVLFTQNRTGLHGQQFRLRKFRSMTSSNDVLDHTVENQPTKIGTILRTLSLDEIPQLINIIRGEMSFIGPRPWIPEYFEHMNKTQRQRTNVLPGLTGLAQVYGRNNLTINQKIKYDLVYVKDISFKEDMKIVFLTIKTVFDKSTQEIAKSGIHNELAILRKQSILEAEDSNGNDARYYSSGGNINA